MRAECLGMNVEESSANPGKIGDGMPTVSVIIPVVRPKTALEAVEAIRAQTWPGPIDVVLVHDGGDFVLAPSNGVVSVRQVVLRPQSGISVARNVGVAASGGSVLAFCDDDDLWDADHLSLTVPQALTVDGLVYTDAVVHHLDEGWEAPFRFLCSPEILRHTLPVMISTLVVPRSVWDRVGPMDPNIPRYADWDWVFRASDRGVPIHRVPHSTVTYRFSTRSTSANREAMGQELARFSQKHGLPPLPVSDFATMVHHPDWADWRID